MANPTARPGRRGGPASSRSASTAPGSNARAGDRFGRGEHARRPSTPAPIPWLPRALLAAAGIGLLVTLVLAVSQESRANLSAPGGWYDAVGRLSGLVGAYLMLVMLVLVARVPVVERSVGQDRLVRWHRRLGGWPIVLIGIHIITVTIGYGQVTHTGFISQLVTFVLHYPDILASAIGFVLLLVAGLSSYRLVRHKLKYETWWVIHLYIYLALSLAFAHQITTGIMFRGHALNRGIWITMWLTGALVIVSSRLILPAIRNARLQLRVDKVKEVAPNVYSVTLKGRGVARLAVSGGQFFQWRFLSRGLWWHSHPYSLSAMPRPPLLRVTIKALGDQSASVARLARGTRVIAEGPYGVFTRHALVSDHAILIGAGVGITPLRALVEDLPTDVKVTAIVRASTRDDVVHGDEVSAIVKARHGDFHEVLGPRSEARLTAVELRELVPDIADGDVYVCGPPSFARDIVRAAAFIGIRAERVHVEEFTF